ncbi:MAG: formate dehydrogenase accessory sulfurtransferase FdhD [Syntrophomonas sp.]|uniref:formate dehydrogenase accessory sulfurtransferase FdhD n=1 Tax=Syntrophomonas sp. TaxID=2053627 RepID=UPI002616CB88|nr:formate dehydrogenase accessory sulfurtransferase FdhD [Syntrophomonas sp.]MDD2509961.1 formate dehydrogenase accessory sulfurtransferase FdhD [Syntrophomonas sp.]MDD3878762.1 formate dehydrogenase accessory sulfurtransferase FdhD [Syntrophomonas sp.]MDD4626662.1 formate dehydrogenase accessory sulfurtransferase FdhD [Syntrophomonas sp.]
MSDGLLFEEKNILMYRQGEVRPYRDSLVKEVPLTVFVNGRELSTLVCSPQAYKELGVGYLLNEGLVSDPADIQEIHHDPEKGILFIEGKIKEPPNNKGHKRYFPKDNETLNSSFYFAKDARQIKSVESSFRIPASRLLQLIVLLEEKSLTFRRTGGVHSAALADNSGLIVRYEDIGRHNAVDKVLGYAFLNTIPLLDKCLVLSGRVASEILIKVARRGIPLILSRSAAMLLAVELAEKLGICVVGFTRGEQFNVYTHPECVIF